MAHFDSLRWDDQKQIESHCSSTSATGGGAKATTVQTRADLQVEYSKSSRATCRGCDEKIEMVSDTNSRIYKQLFAMLGRRTYCQNG